MDTENKVLIEVDINTESAAQDVKALKEEVELLKSQQQQAKKELGETSEEYIKYTAALKNTEAELRRTEKALQSAIATENDEAVTIKKLQAENAKWRAEIDNTNLSSAEGVHRIAELNAKINANNKIIAENSDKFRQDKQNVGNYTDSINEALKGQDLFSGSLSQTMNVFIEMSEEEGGIKNFFKSVTEGLWSATKAGLKFIATPIGAVIAAIVAGIALFKAALNSNQEQSDKFAKVWAGISGIIDMLIDSVGKFASILVDAVSKPKEFIVSLGETIETNIMNRLKAFSKIGSAIVEILSGDFKKGFKNLANSTIQLTTGVENAIDKVGQIGDAVSAKMKKSMADGERLKGMEIELEKQQTKNILTLSALAKKEAELSKISEDNTKSLQEQEAATKELGEVLKQKAILNADIARREFEIESTKLQISKENNATASREQVKAYNEALVKKNEAAAAITNVDKETSKRIREIQKDRLNRELDLLIDSYDSYKTMKEKELTDEKKSATEKIAILKQLDEEGQKSFDKQIELIEKQYNVKIDKDKLINESNAEAATDMVMQLGLADDISGRVLEIMKERRAAISDNAQTERDIMETEAVKSVERLKESFKINYQNELEIAGDNEAKKLELKRNYFKIQEQEELKAAEQTGASVQLIKDKYRYLELDADKQILEVKRKNREKELQMYSDFATQAAGLFEQNTIAYKVASVAQATISTYLAATRAFAETPGGIVIKSIAAGLAVATGLMNVRKILAVNTKGSGTPSDSRALNMSSISSQADNAQMSNSNVNAQVGQGIVARQITSEAQTNKNFGTVLIWDNVEAKQKSVNSQRDIIRI